MLNTNLTRRELHVSLVLVNECLSAMGGSRPSDLENDEMTWISPDDLILNGYSKHEAAGFWSSLSDKGFIDLEVDDTPGSTSDCLSTEAWKYLDTIWDENEHLIVGGPFPIT